MPRSPRVWFPGAWYHVMARGNNKGQVFFKERDYLKYLRLLQDGTKRFEVKIHAYALLPNHIHLMIETREQSISKFVQWTHTTYTGYVNFRYHRVGHLFQGRYKSILIDQDRYALVLNRYIHLNPVRANLVSDPASYPWTSYSAYLKPQLKSFVTTEWILNLISPCATDQIPLFRQFTMGSDPQAEIPELLSVGSDPMVYLKDPHGDGSAVPSDGRAGRLGPLPQGRQ